MCHNPCFLHHTKPKLCLVCIFSWLLLIWHPSFLKNINPMKHETFLTVGKDTVNILKLMTGKKTNSEQ